MSVIAGILIEAGVKSILTEYTSWLEKRQREASWKPGQQNVDDFLAFIRSNTSAKVTERIAAQEGVPVPSDAPDSPTGQ